MSVLKVGEVAPAFSLKDQNGELVDLSDFRGGRLLIYFYPKADTPGCTKQSCAVSESLPRLSESGVRALGISPDAPSRQKSFDEKYGLGFPLLSDEDHAIADSFGVWGEKSMYGKKYMGIIRSAFLIDSDGCVEATWYKVSPANTVPFVLKQLEA